MNRRFLRDEAARFRGMVDDTDREATKLRLLAMAADYDARANDAEDLAGPNLNVPDEEAVEPAADEEATGLAVPKLGETLTLRPARKPAKALKETIVVERRPVGRPRRE